MAKMKDRWPELCEKVSHDDNLPVREVGPHTLNKLWFWHRYIEITTSAMVGHRSWQHGLVYVDLFSGPGICRHKKTKERFPGSPLIAANAIKDFRLILLCEADAKLGDACRSRMDQSPASQRYQLFKGDCNELIDVIAKQIPQRSLTIAFVDPEGLDAQFETVARLSKAGRVDLLLLFADAYDIVRNVELYAQNPNSELDAVLGPDSGWRTGWRDLTNPDGTNTRKFFAHVYKRQLERLLGYKHFGEHTITSDKGPLYRLIYASKDAKGLEFWEKAKGKDRSGQKRLFRETASNARQPAE